MAATTEEYRRLIADAVAAVKRWPKWKAKPVKEGRAR